MKGHAITVDSIEALHRRVGERLAEISYKKFPRGVSEHYVRVVEAAVREIVDKFVTSTGGSIEDARNARLIVGGAFRVRYQNLCASAATLNSLKNLCALSPSAPQAGGSRSVARPAQLPKRNGKNNA